MPAPRGQVDETAGAAHPHPADARRRRLLVSTSAMGAVGLVAAAVPFVESLSPSERARAAGAPVEADISRLAENELMTVEWRGKPVWILHRSPGMIAHIDADMARLNDPQSQRSQQPAYCKNSLRAREAPYFVAIGICTHLGCVPTYRPDVGAADLGPDWPGGFYCPCHGSKYDLAGRVYKNVPAPLNLEIPPYKFETPTLLRIGDEQA